MFTQIQQAFSQSEMNDNLAIKQAPITTSTSVSQDSITTSGSMAANKLISRFFEQPTGSMFFLMVMRIQSL